MKTPERYTIIKKLGEGGMSTVYLGKDPRIGREVAIKAIKKQLAEPESLARFMQEAQSIGSLHHPNIVAIYDADFTDPENLFLIMEYVPGNDLTHFLLPQPNTVDALQHVKYVIDVLRGLQLAHQQGIVHRDIKPANIRISDSSNEAKVMDFGIALATTNQRLTSDGMFLGTISYSSPESFSSEYSFKSDLFSCGVILYQVLTGKHPFEVEGNMQATIHNIISSNIKIPPSSTPSYWDNKLESIIIKSLATEPNDRFPSARDFADALHQWHSNKQKNIENHSTQDTVMIPAVELIKAKESSDLNSPTVKLVIAVRDGNNDAALQMLKKKLDINHAHEGMTALHWAARRGDVQLAAQLIRKGADTDLLDNDHYSPLIWAPGKTPWM